MSTLECLGWRERHQLWLSENNRFENAVPARVSAVYGPLLTVLGLHGDDPFRPETIRSPHDARETFASPCVGDWVSCQQRDGWQLLEVLPRSSYFVRKTKGRSSAAQAIAANLDRVFVVTAVGGDLSVRRLERYLTQVWASGAEPVIVVNKIDREHDARALSRELESVALGVPIVSLSALEGTGVSALTPYLTRNDTVALVGSSGVGKSSLVNRLLGEARLATQPVRAHDETGTHTTTHRELVRAPGGYLLIDTPGMRELGLLDAEAGLDAAFPDLVALVEQCRFRDCQHQREPHCAVRDAIERGLLPATRLASYRALHDELEHNQQRAEQRASDEKQRWRALNKGQRERRKLNAKLGLKSD